MRQAGLSALRRLRGSFLHFVSELLRRCYYPLAKGLGRARERTRKIPRFCVSKISQHTYGMQNP